MSLRQKIENHFQSRSGQGGLVGVIIAAVILSTIIAAATEWYLSMNKSTGRMQEQMEAQSYAYNEWQKVLAEDYNGLSSKDRRNVSDKFDLKRDVGSEKTISGNGKEKDVVITVYRKGTDQIAYAMQSGKARPTLDEYYTKSQVDSKITALQNEMKKMSMPIGTILPYVGSLSNIPSGWHLCDGSAGTPNLKDKFLMGWGGKGVGSYVNAGLPNITGEFWADNTQIRAMPDWLAPDPPQGAFYGEIKNPAYDLINNNLFDARNQGGKLHFDASRSSSIYGNSNTVQPPSYVVYYIMKIS